MPDPPEDYEDLFELLYGVQDDEEDDEPPGDPQLIWQDGYLVGLAAGVQLPLQVTENFQFHEYSGSDDPQARIRVHEDLVEAVQGLRDLVSPSGVAIQPNPQVLPDPLCPPLRSAQYAHAGDVEPGMGVLSERPDPPVEVEDEPGRGGSGYSSERGSGETPPAFRGIRYRGGDAIHVVANSNGWLRKLFSLAVWGEETPRDIDAMGPFADFELIAFQGSDDAYYIHAHRTDSDDPKAVGWVDMKELPGFAGQGEEYDKDTWRYDAGDPDSSAPSLPEGPWLVEWPNLPDVVAADRYHLVKYDGTQDYGEQFGHPVLLEVLDRLCDAWHDATDLKLGIGDLSHVLGGPISGHGSHQHGVDVDIYFLADESGEDAIYWAYEMTEEEKEERGVDFDYWYCVREGANDRVVDGKEVPPRTHEASEELVRTFKEGTEAILDILSSGTVTEEILGFDPTELVGGEDGAVGIARAVIGHDEDVFGKEKYSDGYPEKFAGDSKTGANSDGWPSHMEHIHFRLKYVFLCEAFKRKQS